MPPMVYAVVYRCRHRCQDIASFFAHCFLSPRLPHRNPQPDAHGHSNLAVLVLIGLLAFYSSWHEINNVYDTQLVNNANVLWKLVEDELYEEEHGLSQGIANEKVSVTNSHPRDNDPDDDDDGMDADDYGDARMFRVWRGHRIVMMSDTALPKSIPYQVQGFTDIKYQHDTWRVYTLAVPDTSVRIEVGEKLSLRNALVWRILINLFLPLLVLIPLIGFALWIGITRGLQVISTLVNQIQTRSPDDLSPIGVQLLPRDLAPLGHSINRLFAKLTHSISSERRFADHAAHQLRTPLAGSKLLIQMLRSTDSEQEKDAIIVDLTASNERATALVNKLLIAARVSHQPVVLRAVNFYHAIANAIAEIAPLIAQKQLTITLDGDEEAMVNADETLLSLMISNLVENAIKYTPEHGRITVQLVASNAGWCMHLRDTGPGIPDAEKDLVFERFYRTEMPDIEGAGLGLTIVAEIVGRLGGGILLKTPEDGVGLQVEVTLPRI